ncbi:MAG TPA: bifunctional phosphoglucose/phosphomannose isomerase [bacterium]|nr:bifunctional phosphoglucose/phosphomannose isomerase [bacterium]
MRDFLLNLDRQISEGLTIGRRLSLPSSYRRVKHVLFYGMGGSAISGDILRILVTRRSRDFFAVEHGGRWPNWADRETLAVFSSYSGNTVEVLQHLKDAMACQSPLLMVTSGGKLGEVARKHRIPSLRIPAGLPPRCAIGYLTFSVLPVLEKVGRFRVSPAEIRETLRVIRKARQGSPKNVAKKLFGKSIHLYAAGGLLEPVLIRWRAQLAENAKMLASHHCLPEIFHNEVEGWRFPGQVIRQSLAVFFSDRDDPPSLKKKTRLIQQYIRKQKAKVLEIKSQGNSPLARIFSLISLGDWVSYELALKNGVDPMRIPVIEKLKKIK